MGLSDHTGSLEVSGCLSLRLLQFGFALEREGLLKLFGDVKDVEVPLGSNYWLEMKGTIKAFKNHLAGHFTGKRDRTHRVFKAVSR